VGIGPILKANGKWLFSKRILYNEGVAAWIAPAKNPAWQECSFKPKRRHELR
jgi:hypothetical protein